MTDVTYRWDPTGLDWVPDSVAMGRLAAERDAARNRIHAVCQAVEESQRNGQTVTDNQAICKAIGLP